MIYLKSGKQHSLLPQVNLSNEGVQTFNKNLLCNLQDRIHFAVALLFYSASPFVLQNLRKWYTVTLCYSTTKKSRDFGHSPQDQSEPPYLLSLIGLKPEVRHCTWLTVYNLKVSVPINKMDTMIPTCCITFWLGRLINACKIL